MTLHWYWDDSANSSDDQAEIIRKAADWTDRFPRTVLPELRASVRAAQFDQWARTESYPLAVQDVYGLGQQYGSSLC